MVQKSVKCLFWRKNYPRTGQETFVARVDLKVEGEDSLFETSKRPSNKESQQKSGAESRALLAFISMRDRMICTGPMGRPESRPRANWECFRHGHYIIPWSFFSVSLILSFKNRLDLQLIEVDRGDFISHKNPVRTNHPRRHRTRYLLKSNCFGRQDCRNLLFPLFHCPLLTQSFESLHESLRGLRSSEYDRLCNATFVPIYKSLGHGSWVLTHDDNTPRYLSLVGWLVGSFLQAPWLKSSLT